MVLKSLRVNEIYHDDHFIINQLLY